MISFSERSSRWLILAAAATASALLHGAAFATAVRMPQRVHPSRATELDLEITESSPPPKPAEPPRSSPPPPPAAPRLAALRRSLPPARPTPPPLPNEEPSVKEPLQTSKDPVVPRIGLSFSSTASGGSFAASVGNTLYGKAREIAADPAEVKTYRAKSYAPPARLSQQPRLLEAPRVDYPSEARKADLEGKVILLLQIDREGRVTSARVISEPGAGLGETARAGALRFRFSPAIDKGEAVATEIRFTYTFVLE